MEKQPLSSSCAEQKPLRVVVVGLASCFGCQLQITNQEHFLTDILGRIDLEYWQLASSEPMPEEFDIAIIEGAVTTEEAIEQVKQLRERRRSSSRSERARIPPAFPAWQRKASRDASGKSTTRFPRRVAP